MRNRLIAFWILGMITAGWASAHVEGHTSIHDVMEQIAQRLIDSKSDDELRKLDVDEAKAAITDDELETLAEEYWSFSVDKPVTVWIARFEHQPEIPYWLEGGGFERTDETITADGKDYELWKKDFEAGRIGLGPNGFRFHPLHYFVLLTSEQGGFDVTDMYPGRHFVSKARMNARVYRDESDVRIEEIPSHLENETLLIAEQDRGEETQLVNVFRFTDYVSAKAPDQITLTWSDNPKTTQTVQWRTSTDVTDGFVQYRAAGGGSAGEVSAEMSTLTDSYLANDPVNHRFTAKMAGLEPSSTYAYRVGSKASDTWSEWFEFTTAPDEAVPFSFIYMGDAQNGLDVWGELVHKAYESQPRAAFYIMAGDLVNRGIQRDDWDSFFHNASGIYDNKQLVPAIGNHEDQGEDGPWMYLDLFDLPKNGPDTIDTERAYSFEYSNAFFVVLDSNVPVSTQTAWLDEQLANSDATWKFVVYHHPAYSSGPRRDNPGVRNEWGAVFDKYEVDLALQGHDHAYLRTYPMKGGERVDSPAEGTIYIVSVSGTKYYEQDPRDYTEFGMTNVSTYQVLDLEIDGDKLTYKAYDMEGEVRDEFVIEK